MHHQYHEPLEYTIGINYDAIQPILTFILISFIIFIIPYGISKKKTFNHPVMALLPITLAFIIEMILFTIIINL